MESNTLGRGLAYPELILAKGRERRNCAFCLSFLTEASWNNQEISWKHMEHRKTPSTPYENVTYNLHVMKCNKWIQMGQRMRDLFFPTFVVWTRLGKPVVSCRCRECGKPCESKRGTGSQQSEFFERIQCAHV